MSLRFLTAPVLVALLGLLAGCAVNPATGKSELALMSFSDAQEIKLGQEAFGQALQQMGGEVNDPELKDYVNGVGLRLARVSLRPDLPFRFAVVNDTTPNAFALPGGFVAITRGLLVNLENEAQFAAVLGHEVGHVDARHGLQGMQRGMLLNLGLSVLSGATDQAAYGPVAEQAGRLAAELLDKSYSREQEREADRLGIDYLARADYDPAGAVQVQEFFYRKLEGGAEPGWLSGLFRSHPFSKERLIANQQYIAANYPHSGDPGDRVGEQAFLAATAGLRASREGYALYDRARELRGRGELRDAIAAYLRAAEAAPDEPPILTGLGMAYLEAGDSNAARVNLSRAVALDGDYYLSRLGLGYVYLERGEAARAAAELERSMELLPTLQGGFLLGRAYDNANRPQEALKLYRAVAEADPQGELGREAAGRAAALERRR